MSSLYFPGSAKLTNKSIVTHRTSIYSTTAALLLIAQQCGSRCLTFAANQILLRYLSPEVLGISAQLELYSITVLFFSRESLRITLQRQHESPQLTKSHDENGKVFMDNQTQSRRTQEIVNLAYIPLLTGTVATFLFAWLYLISSSTKGIYVSEVSYFKLSLLLFGLASILELMAEPCYILIQHKSLHYIRATSESIATFMRCLIVCISAIGAVQIGAQIGVLPFALGQVAYSISLLTIYCWNMIQISSVEGVSLLPRRIYLPKTESEDLIFCLFSRPLLSLTRSFFIQSIFKHVLTQGDTFIISILASPLEQGVYSLTSHYGGLIARLILQPIEEISRNYFGNLLSDTSVDSRHKVNIAERSLVRLLRSYLIFSVVIVSIGPTASPVLLKIVAGPKWAESGAGEVLANFCYYIPLLAINGLTEAFVSSVINESELLIQTIWMFFFSLAFSGASLVFVKLWGYGAQGLIMANAFNMILRITWASIFIGTYLKRWQAKINTSFLVPHPMTIAAGVVVSTTIRKINNNFDGSFIDICKIGVMAGGLFVIISIIEQKHFMDCYYQFQSRK